jgi:formate hydrogenlyase subunit 3/multisubunit Na+/H+ antiporter MnhD subunit
MWLFVAGVSVLVVGGVAALLTGRSPKWAAAAGGLSGIAGSIVVLVDAVRVLWTGTGESARAGWSMPLGSLSLGLDPLSAVFVVPIALVVAVAALYSIGYLRHPHGHAHVGLMCFFFNLLAATMLLVVTARNGLLFLMCWEGMSLASFFLVMSEHERESVRRAGWTYLVAMHLGTAFLLVLFLLLGRDSGSLDFDRFSVGPGTAGVAFLLAIVGFGTKAGFIPVHVWLPEAHPAAPSHVSAVMSGVMIKTGIYGLVRTLTFLGPIPAWWGWTLLAIGVVSGILGVLFALAQHDLKRLLAYHSVENIGIIALGLGIGMLGVSYGIPAMAVLGFFGGLLHVFNHAIFKSLLFLGAGAVQQSTGLRDIEHLGGLLKRMPITGGAFLVGACAISGLPPLNGFVSELLIYLGALAGVAEGNRASGHSWALLGVLVIGGLALIGGLAGACFTKAFGCVFLGEPRSAQARDGREAGSTMRVAMLLLAGACIVIGLTAPLWPIVMEGAVLQLIPASARNSASGTVSQAVQPLAILCGASWALLGAVGLVAMVRRRLLRRRQVEREPTWDCGYAAPTARMQYTASSFASPLTALFRMFLRTKTHVELPRGFFPERAKFESETSDVFQDCVYGPMFFVVSWVASKLRWLQQGRLQLYVLYIAVTVLVLLIWKLG